MAVLDVARPLTESESAAFQRMLRLIRKKRDRNQLRTSYHDSKKRLDKIGFSIPPHMKDFAVVLGWPNKAVKVPSRRVRPDGFTLPRQSKMLAELVVRIGGNVVKLVHCNQSAVEFLDAKLLHGKTERRVGAN